MAHTKGQKTRHPCPVCLVPKSALAAYREDWEYRDPRKCFQLATIAQNSLLPQDERKRALDELELLGFRPHVVRGSPLPGLQGCPTNMRALNLNLERVRICRQHEHPPGAVSRPPPYLSIWSRKNARPQPNPQLVRVEIEDGLGAEAAR